MLLVALDTQAVKGERVDRRGHGVQILQKYNVIKSDKDADKSTSERNRKHFAPGYEPASLDYGIWNERRLLTWSTTTCGRLHLEFLRFYDADCPLCAALTVPLYSDSEDDGLSANEVQSFYHEV